MHSTDVQLAYTTCQSGPCLEDNTESEQRDRRLWSQLERAQRRLAETEASRDAASADLVAAATSARHREVALQQQKEEALAAGAVALDKAVALQVRRVSDDVRVYMCSL